MPRIENGCLLQRTHVILLFPFSIRPLLEQVQEGMALDRNLCARFDFEKTVSEEMNFSDEFLISIRFVKPASGVFPSYIPPQDLLNQGNYIKKPEN